MLSSTCHLDCLKCVDLLTYRMGAGGSLQVHRNIVFIHIYFGLSFKGDNEGRITLAETCRRSGCSCLAASHQGRCIKSPLARDIFGFCLVLIRLWFSNGLFMLSHSPPSPSLIRLSLSVLLTFSPSPSTRLNPLFTEHSPGTSPAFLTSSFLLYHHSGRWIPPRSFLHNSTGLASVLCDLCLDS